MVRPNSLLVKVCGMRDHANILEVVKLHPDFFGFIFYKKSPRYVGDEFLMPKEIPVTIRKVGVFVNESLEKISELIGKHRLDFVQLHGEESAEDCVAVRKFGVGVIKVFSVDERFDFERTVPYEKVVDYFLFDTKGKYHGGNAIPFDWSLLGNYNQRVPFLLSGGLNESNLSKLDSLKQYNLRGVDMNSGVEDSPGLKNLYKFQSVLNLLSTNF